MTIVSLAMKSLLDRKASVMLAMLAMTISIFVLLCVEDLRHQVKHNFSNTVSGVDLVVGARTGSLNLLLYSVFRIGSPTNNISWQTSQDISANENVDWAIPVSLGDSHKGYRVLGTSTDYFRYFSYGNGHSLEFVSGNPFEQTFDVVLGAEVARKLSYGLGDKLTLAHGMAATSFTVHDEHPFTIVGILAPTGTPVDQTLHISLQGMEAVHVDWKQEKHGHQHEGHNAGHEHAALQPENITAIFLGLKSKLAIFKLQRAINNYPEEPLLAILPGVALSELWQMMSVLENSLLLVSVLVFVAASLGVSAMLYSSIRERSQEIHLLRIIGAPPHFLFLLVELEALLITLSSCVLGSGLVLLCLTLMQDYLVAQYGLHVEVRLFTANRLYLMAAIVSASVIVAAIPSFSGYRRARSVQH